MRINFYINTSYKSASIILILQEIFRSSLFYFTTFQLEILFPIQLRKPLKNVMKMKSTSRRQHMLPLKLLGHKWAENVEMKVL